MEKFPKISIVTSWIEDKLTAEGALDPGLGDFGDRYFGTM